MKRHSNPGKRGGGGNGPGGSGGSGGPGAGGSGSSSESAGAGAQAEAIKFFEDRVNRSTGALEELVTYPIATLGTRGRSGGAGTGAGLDGGSLASSAAETVLGTVGLRNRTYTTQEFFKALGKTFKLSRVGDHTVAEYRQTFSVTPGQFPKQGPAATLSAHMAAVLERALPSFDSVKSMRVELDAEGNEALRSILRDLLGRLAAEFNRDTGVVVQRVDNYFALLVGLEPVATDPAKVGGHVGRFRERLGLTQSRATTVEWEEHVSKFHLGTDLLLSLYQSWRSKRAAFSRGGGGTEPFLGNQLSALSQLLEVIAESAQDVFDQLDAKLIGEGERQVLELMLGEEDSPIPLQDVIKWALDLATVDGPAWLRQGKQGIVVLQSTADRLAGLVEGTWGMALVPADTRIVDGGGLQTAGVRRALQDLHYFLAELGRRAGETKVTDLFPVESETVVEPISTGGVSRGSPPPYVREIESGEFTRNHKHKLNLRLDRPYSGLSVCLGDDLCVESVKGGEDDDQVIVEFFSSATTRLGWHPLKITTLDGKTYFRQRAVNIIEPPADKVCIRQVDPPCAEQGESGKACQIFVDHLTCLPGVSFGPGVEIRCLSLTKPKSDNDPTVIHASLDVADDAAVGKRDVILHPCDGQPTTLCCGFEIKKKDDCRQAQAPSGSPPATGK